MRVNRVYIIANFGGPRNLNEVEEFLVALLTDDEVIRTSFPAWLQKRIFAWVAKRRAKRVVHDYAIIGGASPIFADTESMVHCLQERLNCPILAFHRYLPKTHGEFLRQLDALSPAEIDVFPLYPQFSYTTTGSSAKWIRQHVPQRLLEQLRWIRSYPNYAGYIEIFAQQIHKALSAFGMNEEKSFLLFSAHGLPKRFVLEGDPYEQECKQTFSALANRFPRAKSILCFQSKFGRKEWLSPATQEICGQLRAGERRHVLLIPLSFTSDHLETLFEMEQLYLPLLRKRGFHAMRCPALHKHPEWMGVVAKMLECLERVPTEELMRPR